MDAPIQAERVKVRSRPLERFVAALSIFAALIHGVVTPAHFEEWWGYGLFFIVVAVAQALFGIALLTNAINPKDFGPNWANARRALLWFGVVGNALIILMWVLTRTVGIPLGPALGETEAVGALDVASKIAEALIIGCLVAILWSRPKDLADPAAP